MSGKSQGLSISYLGLADHEPVSWITQVLPNSILKPFPIINLKKFKSITKIIGNMGSKRNLIYIYEGSFSWLILLDLLSINLGSSNLVCNLFPASKYEIIMFRNDKMKLKYRFLFWYFSRIRKVKITVDTNHLQKRINASLRTNPQVNVFPLPSSFELLAGEKSTENEHLKVLVNIRKFPLSELTELLSDSCKSCEFVFPVGVLDKHKDSYGLQNFTNAKFEERSIQVENYQSYIDGFDYMIFLYEPSLDSSGKILDCITRKIPVCLPKQATEWVETSQKWNSTFLFEFGDNQSTAGAFNHPHFALPRSIDLPTCTPLDTLRVFSSYDFSPKTRQLSKPIGKILLTSHYVTALLIGKTFSFRQKISRGARE